MKKLYVVGMGPGQEVYMTVEARRALRKSDTIVGYPVYLEQLSEEFAGKRLLSTPMKQERKRCVMAFEEAMRGRQVSMLCSGDAGVYGMASLMYEVGVDYPEIELKIIAGVTAANSGAAMLGAPLGNDYCVISLSDILTPMETIIKRLRAAAAADFSIVLYNPSSKKREDYLEKACDILLEYMPQDRPCGIVERIGREGARMQILPLDQLRKTRVNMFTTVFIGASATITLGGRLVTKRGYHL
ncbi:precorrin-3B C(17)-methyltransferase [Shuttleworthella satelles]|uniref:Precorrin-3B C(17)-methyltransferase n=1 Tax=Shuttleworthella satelles DSM 14600 TaxID=626523 RepID=C4GBG6_9FIRM|nr:precorrin-3B C(17)-methyltransferase [Shuttleworthia satelles]EEP28459.1 precorrin-3B C(17)-methyltransferase [Shuttleworthia satelles DSM 14600]